jgi:tRNA uridine 5-carboxymethylaminomethyl modification enzyme
MTNTDFDIIVVGGGHAGIEACSAAARMGLRVALVTMERQKIGLMSCNPAIGGIAKGQLVREIDALGGEMARNIDQTGIHFKMLNKSRGPAVWSPRAQAGRKSYAAFAQSRLSTLKNLSIIESTVCGIDIMNKKIQGIILNNDEKISGSSVVLTTGTFLNGIIHIGMNSFAAGRAGEKPARGITESLVSAGLEAGRLKTGTPPRIYKDSIDFSNLSVQEPDIPPTPFSFSTKSLPQRQIPCHMTYTNRRTHEILREGFSQSPLFTGKIKSIGPRYCPSIETKIDRFSERERHQLFIEPEGYADPEVYLNGFSTSLPEKTQIDAIRSIAGLEKAEIVRLGYAVEYDYFPPYQLKYSLESKFIEDLYFAGQINGTSGYEEAAAQGLIAGINAAAKLLKLPALKIDRSEAYIGVLIDDLINKSTVEPYRMFTSRAEFRLSLRQDNADLRLAKYGIQYGLLDDNDKARLDRKVAAIDALRQFIAVKKISVKDYNTCFNRQEPSIKHAVQIETIIKRPEIGLKEILSHLSIQYNDDVIQEVEFSTKYAGYIKRNLQLMARFARHEDYSIPAAMNYSTLKSLSSEAKEKLSKIRPISFGQASRISGISPADLAVLLVYLEKEKQTGNVPRET